MSTSQSYNYVINRGEMIQKAAEEIGAVEVGGAMPTDMAAFFAAQLNMMLKNWHGASLKDLFRLRRTVLIVATDTVKYTLGGTAHWVYEDDLGETYINADQTISGAATTITVDSTSGMAVGDNLGLELEDGSIQWTTIATVDSSTTVTPSDSWTDDIDDNDIVYWYTTKATAPLWLVNAWRRTRSDSSDGSQGTDTDIGIISRQEYITYGSKSATGTPIALQFDPQLSAPLLNVYPIATDVGEKLYFKAAFPWEDMDTDDDDIGASQAWYLPILLGLSRRIASKYGCSKVRRDQINEDFQEALQDAYRSDREKGVSVFIQPDTGM